MTFAAFDARQKSYLKLDGVQHRRGALAENNEEPTIESKEVYDMRSMTEILNWCERTGKVTGSM